MISNKRQSKIEEKRYILDKKKSRGITTQYFIGDATHNDASCARGTGRPETRQPETEVDIRMVQITWNHGSNLVGITSNNQQY